MWIVCVLLGSALT